MRASCKTKTLLIYLLSVLGVKIHTYRAGRDFNANADIGLNTSNLFGLCFGQNHGRDKRNTCDL